LALTLHHSPHLPTLPSFPTRRSSDLHRFRFPLLALRWQPRSRPETWLPVSRTSLFLDVAMDGSGACIFQFCFQPSSPPSGSCSRSEEHTSELQSRVDLVCRLLLEKKK